MILLDQQAGLARRPRSGPEVLAEQLARHPYAQDPVGWIETRCDAYVWGKGRVSGQAGICESVRDHRFTAVRACHGVGKSYICARIIAWWIDTRPDAFVVTSAPSAHQVKTILWREVKKAQREAGLAGNITNDDVPVWTIDGDIVGFGRKPADFTDTDAAAAVFQGIHALNVLVVLDEADGIPEWLINAAEALVTNEQSRVLAVGNPMDPSSAFAKMQQPGQGYNTIRIAYTDAPAFTGEAVPEYLSDLLISPLWVEERRRRWGEGSPLWMGRVEAEYPEVTDDTLITPAMIRAAWERDLSGRAIVAGRMGFDVARYGVDECVVYWNRGGMIRLTKRWGRKDTMETAGLFKMLYDDELDLRDEVPVNIDIVGLGAGVYDRLKEQRLPVIPFNGAEKAYDPLHFKNRRSETFWALRELFEAGEVDLDPEDLDLANELQLIQWTVDSQGRRVIEPKDEIKKRLGRSPDRADAASMSTQFPVDWQHVLNIQRSDSLLREVERNRASEPEDLVSDLMEASL